MYMVIYIGFITIETFKLTFMTWGISTDIEEFGRQFAIL